MPNRILHESIKYCPKMEQLNWFEEVVYHRLTVTVITAAWMAESSC